MHKADLCLHVQNHWLNPLQQGLSPPFERVAALVTQAHPPSPSGTHSALPHRKVKGNQAGLSFNPTSAEGGLSRPLPAQEGTSPHPPEHLGGIQLHSPFLYTPHPPPQPLSSRESAFSQPWEGEAGGWGRKEAAAASILIPTACQQPPPPKPSPARPSSATSSRPPGEAATHIGPRQAQPPTPPPAQETRTHPGAAAAHPQRLTLTDTHTHTRLPAPATPNPAPFGAIPGKPPPASQRSCAHPQPHTHRLGKTPRCLRSPWLPPRPLPRRCCSYWWWRRWWPSCSWLLRVAAAPPGEIPQPGPATPLLPGEEGVSRQRLVSRGRPRAWDATLRWRGAGGGSLSWAGSVHASGPGVETIAGGVRGSGGGRMHGGELQSVQQEAGGRRLGGWAAAWRSCSCISSEPPSCFPVGETGGRAASSPRNGAGAGAREPLAVFGKRRQGAEAGGPGRLGSELPGPGGEKL